MLKLLATRPYLVFAIVTFVLMFILDNFFGITDSLLRAVIAASVAFIISPRVKIIETQDGNKKQITWVFLKKAIIID